VLRGCWLTEASDDNVSSRRPFGWVADVADTARRRRKRQLGLEGGRTTPPQWLRMEGVGLPIAVKGSQQLQDTPFKKAVEGLRPVFSAYVRFGERGHPSSFLGLGFGSRVLVSRVYRSVKGLRPERPTQENCPVSSVWVLG
jgi:hypothetical protein